MVLLTCLTWWWVPLKEPSESCCVNWDEKAANWPEPESLNESHMCAGATSWTEPLNRARTTDIFSNIDQMGPALFYSKSCLMSESCSKACTQDWIPLLPNTHWQHTEFDELTRKTSFSKLADIKYTWSLPSILMTSWWRPQEVSLARPNKSSHKLRELFLRVCLGQVSSYFFYFFLRLQRGKRKDPTRIYTSFTMT